MKKFFDPYFFCKPPTMNIRKKAGIDHTDWINPTIVADTSLFSANTGRVGYITEKTRKRLLTWSTRANPWQQEVWINRLDEIIDGIYSFNQCSLSVILVAFSLWAAPFYEFILSNFYFKS